MMTNLHTKTTPPVRWTGPRTEFVRAAASAGWLVAAGAAITTNLLNIAGFPHALHIGVSVLSGAFFAGVGTHTVALCRGLDGVDLFIPDNRYPAARKLGAAFSVLAGIAAGCGTAYYEGAFSSAPPSSKPRAEVSAAPATEARPMAPPRRVVSAPTH